MAWYSYLRRGENGASALREGSELEQSRSQSLSMADQPLLAVAGGPDGDGHPAENTPAAENYASISPDGRFLVFDRREVSDSGAPAVDIYWVGAEVIEALRNSH